MSAFTDVRRAMMAAAVALLTMCSLRAAADAQTPPTDSAAQPAPAAPAIDDAALARSARASKLIGSEVYSGGASAGKIEDVLIDREHAAVTAAILSVGGFLGMGDKKVAIPIQQIKLGNEAKFVIDMTKDDLKNAPAFDYTRLK